MHSHMTAGNSPSMCSHFGIVHWVRDTSFWGVSRGNSCWLIPANFREQKTNRWILFFLVKFPVTNTSVSSNKRFHPPPQMSSDTEFLISDNTHFHSNKQWWPKHRIMWLHSESSRILTRILIANSFHFCGISLQRISGSFPHHPQFADEETKRRRNKWPILRSRKEAGLRVPRKEGREEW